MKLKVLGSGSSGNCYLLENEKECLVIEAGLPFREVKRAIDYDVMKIVGVICSHTHGDHARYLHQYEKAGIRSFLPYNDSQKQIIFENFMIQPFDLVHDVPCYGFIIFHPDIGKLLYASDTEYIKYRFGKSEIRHFLVEANYDPALMDHENQAKDDHVFLSHMSLNTCIEFLEKSASDKTENIILCHLSSSNADPENFKNQVSQRFGCHVDIARKNLTISLS